MHKLLAVNKEELNRKIAQLEIVARLRNIQQIIIEEEQKMALNYRLEDDIRFKQGVEKGLERLEISLNQEKLSIVKNLLLRTDFTARKIASLAAVSTEFVKEIKKKLH